MKSIIKLFILCAILLLVLFLWQELPELSTLKKINAEKVSSFFTAIGSLLTALTVFLLYKQIKEQIEDRKASSKPDLYPANQFFRMEYDKTMPRLTRDGKAEGLSGLISIHNIGFGAAKEITINWRLNSDVLSKLVDGGLREFYKGSEVDDSFSFVSANNQIEAQLPLLYMASLSSFQPGWTQMIWEELYMEISYKDIHDFQYSPKIFKITVHVDTHFASFRFSRVGAINLSNKSTQRSILFDE